MQTITATVPVTLPPSWAAQQRLLLDTMSDSVYPFLDRYTHGDGELIYDDRWGGGADDFYEGLACPRRLRPISTWFRNLVVSSSCRYFTLVASTTRRRHGVQSARGLSTWLA